MLRVIASAVSPGLPVNTIELFGPAPQAEILFHGRLQLLFLYALELILLQVVLGKLFKESLTDDSLDGSQELEALVIGNDRERVVGVVVLYVWEQ